jgi:hypothetical protein
MPFEEGLLDGYLPTFLQVLGIDVSIDQKGSQIGCILKENCLCSQYKCFTHNATVNSPSMVGVPNLKVGNIKWAKGAELPSSPQDLFLEIMRGYYAIPEICCSCLFYTLIEEINPFFTRFLESKQMY